MTRPRGGTTVAAVRALCLNAIDRLDDFTDGELANEVGSNAGSVGQILRKLEAAGTIAKSGGRRHGRQIYRALDKKPKNLPQKTETRQKSVSGNLWQAMKRLQKFQPSDLVHHATDSVITVDLDAARAYCRELARAGYLKVIRPARPKQYDAAYLLILDTGPLPPSERRVRGIWDGNLGKFTYLPEVAR